ncbi:MAG: Sapep family Mn(2+)-dependent dipeptidase [Solobacterium sp.]|nr:Sapep family Mn(2+)-dependent dipeptidase [Solobacterium sp.]
MTVKEMIQQYEQEMLDKLAKLVAINSVEGVPSQDAPFGEAPKEALLCALQMMEEDGFKTVNLDNYCGYAEMGEGEEVIGVIGHLDIVPAKQEDGWNTNPFEMVNDGTCVYGRGVSDDKGPVVASMMAMKILRDLGFPLSKRIRLIMGTNEETGSKCLKHYVECEGDVNYGFTPDGEFPGVYGEKGMVHGVYRSKKTELLSVLGEGAMNIVSGKCSARVVKNSYSTKKFKDYLNQNEMRYEIEEKEEYDDITVYGLPAHASTPELGKNAISYLFMGLKEAGLQDAFVDFYCSHFGLHTDGEGLCKCEDEYGALTLNTGVISMKDGVIEGSIDIRFPVTLTSKQVVKMIEENKEDEGGEIEVLSTTEPLYFPPDSPMIESLVKAYRDVTGDEETQLMTMGGGTYAKGIGNTIAFGAGFPNRDYHIHNANEFAYIDELKLQVEIYVEALQNLLNL